MEWVMVEVNMEEGLFLSWLVKNKTMMHIFVNVLIHTMLEKLSRYSSQGSRKPNMTSHERTMKLMQYLLNH